MAARATPGRCGCAVTSWPRRAGPGDSGGRARTGGGDGGNGPPDAGGCRASSRCAGGGGVRVHTARRYPLLATELRVSCARGAADGSRAKVAAHQRGAPSAGDSVRAAVAAAAGHLVWADGHDLADADALRASGVVVYDRPPYEARGGKYWLHVLKTLAAPADARKRVGAPMEFHLEPLAAGGNPFYSAAFAAWPEVEAWSGRRTSKIWPPSASAASTAGTWRPPPRRARRSTPLVYFAEKHFPDAYPRLMRELYPAARELFLVRDFRDMVASMRPTTRARDSATSAGDGRERRGVAGRAAPGVRRPA